VKRRVVFALFLLGVFLVAGPDVSAQTSPPAATPLPDTLSAAVEEEETVFYTSDRITYDIGDSTLVLTGNAVLKYDNITLKAGEVRFNTLTEMLTADRLPDSVGVAPEANLEPTLEDSEGTLVGARMQYSLKTRRGRILDGRTQYEEGFFEGRQLRIENENSLHIHIGSYTTCDRPEHRHYWLKVGKAKILRDDKAILKNVTAYVYGVPVFYLPFYILPLKRGRHSGFTVPTYGSGVTEGTYIRNLGCYWAASDYWDLRLTGDVESARGFLLKPYLRYAKAGRTNGSVGGSYQSSFGLKPTGWDIAANHWQELRPDLKVRGQAQFASRLSFVHGTTRGNDPTRLQSSLRSSFSLDKNWDQKSLNLSVSESSPTGKPVRPTTSLSFRLPSRPLFAPPQRRRTGGMPDFGASRNTDKRLWYQSILLGYNGSLRDQKQSTGTRQDIVNQFNGSSQQTAGGWFHFGPQGSYSETWFRQTGKGFDRQNAYNVGVQANTTLYGLFRTRIGRLQDVRHVMTPSVSFSQAGPRNASRSASFGLSNILQARTEHEDKTQKFDLLFVNLSSAYNFKAKTRPWSDINASVRVPANKVNVDGNLTYDLYRPVVQTFRRPWLKTASLNTSINLTGERSASTETFAGAFSSAQNVGSTGFGGSGSYGSDRFDENFDRIKGPWSVSLSHRYSVGRVKPDTSFSTSSHVVSALNRFDLDSLTGLFGLSNPVTAKWRVEHAFNYDVRRKTIVSHSFNFHRSLHCWELYFRWTPTGFNKGIYFRINIIAIPEIKIEQQRSSN